MAGYSTNPGQRAIWAAVVGNVLEWYDFAVYGFLAGVIAKQFFPAADETTSLLASFAAFGVGFLARPLGGIVIGRLGDSRGRKIALLVTIHMMAAGTVLVGLVPDYQTIGIAAPALIVVARLIQGFSAGGEWGGSTAFIVEWAGANRRGFYGSFQQSSVALGLLLGSAVAALVDHALTPEAFASWGWRLPFLFGGVLAPVGFYLRRKVDETPAYRAIERAGVAPASAPGESSPALAARAFGFTILWTVSYYIFLSYMPTFAQIHLGLGRAEALWSNAVGLLVLALVAPVFGHLSDAYGRKPFLLACCAGFVLLPYPLFALLLGGASLPLVIVVQITLALLIGLFSGPGPAAIAEIFPTARRSSLMSIGYSLSVAVFGGFAPFFATWLIAKTGSPSAPAFYVMAAAAVSALVIARLRETAHLGLR